nr:hypothetical protein CFP56_16527 [Quercus suber]
MFSAGFEISGICAITTYSISNPRLLTRSQAAPHPHPTPPANTEAAQRRICVEVPLLAYGHGSRSQSPSAWQNSALLVIARSVFLYEQHADSTASMARDWSELARMTNEVREYACGGHCKVRQSYRPTGRCYCPDIHTVQYCRRPKHATIFDVRHEYLIWWQRGSRAVPTISGDLFQADLTVMLRVGCGGGFARTANVLTVGMCHPASTGTMHVSPACVKRADAENSSIRLQLDKRSWPLTDTCTRLYPIHQHHRRAWANLMRRGQVLPPQTWAIRLSYHESGCLPWPTLVAGSGSTGRWDVGAKVKGGRLAQNELGAK